ncbi:hypothetical protein BC829DRAFT_389767 [Chytridium lagenaria]|nr:hypothetical protein BC829DRAFT_389767 [Chytridium lagenaria]
MPETHQKLERKIVELLESFFTPCSLRIDLLLQNTIKEDPDRWVRMDFFSHGHRLGGLAKDEAVVAKAVRQYSEILERTVYLENLPRDSTYKSLKEMLKDFATIDQIVWPAPLLHGEIYEPSKRTSIYAFVTCVTEKECLKLRSAIRSLRLSKGGRGSQSLKRVRDDLDGIRVLPITEWDFRTKIYMEKQQERKEKLTALLRGASGTETTLKFEGGTVCQFKNVHPNTSAKVLKQLFEMVAPVSFVDYQRGEKEVDIVFY